MFSTVGGMIAQFHTAMKLIQGQAIIQTNKDCETAEQSSGTQTHYNAISQR